MEKLTKLKNSVLSMWSTATHHSYKILLIGQTGSGKTSFINLLCNCALLEKLKLRFDDDKGLKQLHVFNDITLENVSSKPMASKTSGAKLYNTELFGLKIGIIDTPGFGDSRGLEQDNKNVEAIIESIKQEDHINCICFIINGTESREVVILKYVLTAITTILPKQITNNLIVVFTNTEDEFHLNFEVETLTKFLNTSIPEERTFLIDNPYCILEKAKLKVAKTGKELRKETTTKIGMHFLTAVEVLKNMGKQIQNFQPVHTEYFLSLYETKEKIEENVLKLITEFKNQMNWTKTMVSAKAEAEAAMSQKKLYANYSTKYEFKRTNVVNTDRHNTLCGHSECYSNCHKPCHLKKAYDKEKIKSCASMDDEGICTKCKHSYSEHYHNEVYFVIENCVEDLIDENMKAEYEKAQSMEQRKNILLQQCNKKIEESEKKKQIIGTDLLSVLDQFHTMGMSRNYCKVVENQVEIIEHHIQATSSEGHRQDTTVLRKVKEDLETKLILVRETLHSIPYSSNVKKKEWARMLLGISEKEVITKSHVEQAYKAIALIHHPDKGGDTELFKRILHAKETLLSECSY